MAVGQPAAIPVCWMEITERGGRVGRRSPSGSIEGTTGGLPYIAFPPYGAGPAGAAPLLLVWHVGRRLRTARAVASALPLSGLAAWRLYLTGMPPADGFPAGRPPGG